MWIDGQLVLSDSDIVKMCIVVIMPAIAMTVVSLVAYVTDKISKRNKEEESQ